MFTASPVLSTAGVGVLGTGACLPGRVLTNDEVGAPADVDHAWILRKTGIQERRWAKPDEATSDLAGQAGREALAQAGIAAADLAVVIVATSTPDHPQPPTANLVQYRLGALRAAAFDVNAVCSGFVFALAVGNQMVAANRGYALVIGADVYSRILNPADRKTAVLFGDGAGAVVLGPVTGRRGILATALHSFGEQWELIRVPGGGSRYPASADVLAAGSQYFTMDGRAVREFVEDSLPRLVTEFLAEAGVAPHEVDHLVPHQANGVMLDTLESQLDLPNATVHRTVDRYGNTGAASVPITLHEMAGAGLIKPGQLVLLTGFGGGMAVGMAVVRW
jgi:3-oxoacyl-(acyl-carrier-protein) synthase III